MIEIVTREPAQWILIEHSLSLMNLSCCTAEAGSETAALLYPREGSLIQISPLKVTTHEIIQDIQFQWVIYFGGWLGQIWVLDQGVPWWTGWWAGGQERGWRNAEGFSLLTYIRELADECAPGALSSLGLCTQKLMSLATLWLFLLALN